MKNCCKTALRSLSSGDPFTAVYLMIPEFGGQPSTLPLPHFRLHPILIASGMWRTPCGWRQTPVPGDADVVRLTVTVPVVHTVYRLTVNLQAALRCLKQVMESPVPVLVKASAAGVAAVLCLASVHDDGLFAAMIITVMKTVRYITIQLCHDGFLLNEIRFTTI